MHAFDYQRPSALSDAAAALASDPEAKLLAGGQTLLPTLKQRLAQPTALVDLSRIPGLVGITAIPEGVSIGAMTRHAQVASSSVVRAVLPALADLAGEIGDAAVRNRGTIGGSLANDDPTADYPSAVLALNATVVTDRREIPAGAYFRGLFETALAEGEIITRVDFPKVERAGYAKFRNPASRYAMAGVFVAKTAAEVRVAVTGASQSGVFLWEEAGDVLTSDFSPAAVESLALDPSDLMSDLHGSAEYRAQLVKVMCKRAVAKALG
ncbi:xanthine dehydrogenase family protein subunit M [Xanthobacter dioxanivorans]|uniref:Xanthine dehydrogenase family protein subunit M n=1 Tax=Xanthobacter dioxanivorans TaxID=2528964 RepID=A0A974SHG7_9HYPH|nr:xanthine dehydrogenase family protein subunit M [Xanthobacter dioxanivorans]QRG05680.1 xanthine dehydrogenase family protein subunit M [Xanthobacter dioxanivorans]